MRSNGSIVGMVRQFGFVAAVVVLVYPHSSQADIPVHCMADDVLGTWDVKMTAATTTDLYTDADVCGHTRPDDFAKSMKDNDGFKNWWADRLPSSDPRKSGVEIENYQLCIPHANQTGAELCPQGEKCGEAGCLPLKFTLLYDEGLLGSVTMANGVHIKFFTMFKYGTKSGSTSTIPELSDLKSFVSYCDETISSFWSAHHKDIKGKDGKVHHGCLVMKKTTPVAPHTSEARDLDHVPAHEDPVLSPNLLETSVRSRARAFVTQALHDRQKQASKAFLHSKAIISDEAIARINNGNFGYTASSDSAQAFLQQGTYAQALQRLGVSAASRSMQRLDTYLEEFMGLSEEGCQASCQSSDTDLTCSSQCSLIEESSKAEEGVTSTEMINQELNVLHKDDLGFTVSESLGEVHIRDIEAKCALEVFPKEFDWSNPKTTKCKGILPEAADQKSCGSCYSFAFATAATARYRIASHPDPKCSSGNGERDPEALKVNFSPQSVLQCSYANQGCDGGYPASAAYHAFADGIYTEKCDPYTAQTKGVDSCVAPKADKSCKRYFVDDFSYAGGPYGYGVSMAAMMADLIEYGPMAVAIEAPPSLGSYKAGVFRPTWNRDVSTNVGKHGYFQKTNHAITLIGYGVEKVKGKKTLYWKLRNSWGPDWGDKGNFKIERGTDIISSETMPLAVRFSKGSSSVKGKVYMEKYRKCIADAQSSAAAATQ